MASGVKDLDGRVGCRDMVMFDPWKIEVEKNFNPRSAEGLRANIDRLKPMIEAHGGVYEPLWVRRDGDRCILIGGESRLFGTRELLTEGRLPKYQGTDPKTGNPKPFGVPVLYRDGMEDEAERINMALLENSGAPLEKWELGRSFARMKNAGWEVADIAKRQGRTPQFVSSCITLNDSPTELRQMLIMGAVSEGRAIQAIKKYGSKAAEIVAASPRNAKGKVVRGKVVKFDLKALKEACEAVLAEADTDPDAAMKEITRETIEALRQALK